MNAVSIIFSAVFLVVGVALLIFAILQNRSAKQKAQTWLTCPGVVLNSGLESHYSHDSDGSSSTNYNPQVTYQYTVNNQVFTGGRLGFGAVSYDYGTASRKLSPYPPGAPVIVHYNPQNPMDAVLEPKATGSWLIILIAVIITVIGIVMLMTQLLKS